MKNHGRIPRVYFAAAVTFAGAFAAMWIHAYLAAAVLAGFVLTCMAGAFFAGTGLFLPVISRGPGYGNAVALTFDDGPDPQTTPFLLGVLKHSGVQATFFVSGKKAENHPEIIGQILEAGHFIGNHTYSHDIWIMLRSAKVLEAEIQQTQKVLEESGIRPAVFRPPAGVVNPSLKTILEKYQMDCILYSCRGPDFGNRRIKGLAGRIARKIKAGHIVLLHDGYPATRRFDPASWLKEIEKIIEAIAEKGLCIQPLCQLTGRPVMYIKKTGRSRAEETK